MHVSPLFSLFLFSSSSTFPSLPFSIFLLPLNTAQPTSTAPMATSTSCEPPKITVRLILICYFPRAAWLRVTLSLTHSHTSIDPMILSLTDIIIMQIINKYLEDVLQELSPSPKSKRIQFVKPMTKGRGGNPDTLSIRVSELSTLVPPPDHLRTAIEAVGRWSTTASFDGTTHRCSKINREAVETNLLAAFEKRKWKLKLINKIISIYVLSFTFFLVCMHWKNLTQESSRESTKV